MAKKRTRTQSAGSQAELPTLAQTVDIPVKLDVEPVSRTPEIVEPEPKQTVRVAKMSKVSLASIPFLDLGKNAYRNRRVDVQNMTGGQRENLKCIVLGLQQEGEKLESGKYVTNYSDAIKWMLENVKP